MKKLLLASSALVLSAGYAAAEVTLNGDGYMGIGYGDDGFFGTAVGSGQTTNGRNGDVEDWSFIFDLDFQFVGTGETDGGLIFGAELDADEMDSSQGPYGWDGVLFVQGDFGKLSMGDTDGAAEAVIGDLAGIGISGLGDFNEFTYLLAAGDPTDCDVQTETFINEDGDPFEIEVGDDDEGSCGSGPLALYEYATGGLSLALGADDDQGYSVGIGYAGDFWSVGLAYESVLEGSSIVVFDNGNTARSVVADTDVDQWIGSASFTWADATFKGIYGRIEADDDIDQWGLSVDWTLDLWNVTAYYRAIDEGSDSVQMYGAGVTYDLGGGLAVGGGIMNFDDSDFVEGSDDNVIADFGLAFTF